MKIYDVEGGTEIVYGSEHVVYKKEFFPGVYDVDEDLAYNLMGIKRANPYAGYCTRCGDYSEIGLDNNGDCPSCGQW